MWTFDNKVAEIFPSHARQHIPNYDKVIQKTLDICADYSADSAIVDVGCAVGETLVKLHHNGFTNLYGVDNSQSMLDRCPKNIGAEYILSDKFEIDKKFDVIIINWTMHFIKDKRMYLEQVRKRLNTNGTLILTDKTSVHDFPQKHYYNLKRANGVSEAEIQAKATSLENVMHIKDVQWYLTAFMLEGFTTHIFDADWCFTSFVCK